MLYVCMCVCVYIYITYIHIPCMHVCMYVCIHACMYVCMYSYIERERESGFGGLFGAPSPEDVDPYQ